MIKSSTIFADVKSIPSPWETRDGSKIFFRAFAQKLDTPSLSSMREISVVTHLSPDDWAKMNGYKIVMLSLKRTAFTLDKSNF